MRRRRFLAASGALLPTVAGCVGTDGDPRTSGNRTTTSDGPPAYDRGPNVSEAAGNSTEGREDPQERSDQFSGLSRTSPPGEPPLSPSGEWPTYRFDAGNSGYNPSGSGLRAADAYWRLRPTSAATVADGRLYAAYHEDDEGGVFSVRDPGTVAVVRRGDARGTNVSVPPVVADGRAVLTYGTGVICVDVETAESRWEAGVTSTVSGIVAVRDGVVYAGSAAFESEPASVLAYELDTGERRWRSDVGSNLRSSVSAGDEHVFASTTDGLHALDATSGEERYVLEASGSVTPVLQDGLVYVVDEADTTELLAVDAASGDVQWRVGPVTGSPPVADSDLVHVTSADDGIVALDISDGSRAVTYDDEPPGSSVLQGTPVGRVGDVLYSRREGTVLANDVETGEQLWAIQTARVRRNGSDRREVHHVTPVTDAVYVSARDGFYGIGPA